MKYKFIAFSLSGIIIAVGIWNIAKEGKLNKGIDFSGGALIQVRFKNPVSITEVRQLLRNVGLGNSRIQEVEKGHREYIIRTMPPEEETAQELEAHDIMGKKIIDILKTEEDRTAADKGLKDLNNIGIPELTSNLKSSFPDKASEIAKKIINLRRNPEDFKGIIENFDQLTEKGISPEVITLLKEKTFLGSLAVRRKETVGSQVGEDLEKKAVQATVWALIGMLIYIGLRFKLAYGIAAIFTLAHDVIITLTFFSLSNRELNLPVVAAILTIVGYSLNDTIVIFDRVRDNLKGLRGLPFEEVLNTSINQTLSRTIITSGTTLMTVVALFLFGGEVINDFAFTMIIGVITGTYSSIYQSCSLLYFWKIIFKPKKGMGR